MVMKKSLVLAGILAVTGLLSVGAVPAKADELLTGFHTNSDKSVMGVGQTVLESGAAARAHTNMVNLRSRSENRYDTNSGVNMSQQFGSSQTDQSWKKARKVEEAQVRGLVAGDCQGDNSTDAYRKAMGQTRAGYTTEHLVSNSQCQADHATVGGAPAPAGAAPAPAGAH
jgi:hypothetical protein